MDEMDFERLVNRVKQDEGFSSTLYQCTAGKWTVGYGLNLESGITEDEAEAILGMRLRNLHSKMLRFGWYSELDGIRQTIIANMVYQLGEAGVLKFRKMIEAITLKDYDKAAVEMMDSKWFQQTQNRANRLIEAMRTGAYPK